MDRIVIKKVDYMKMELELKGHHAIEMGLLGKSEIKGLIG